MKSRLTPSANRDLARFGDLLSVGGGAALGLLALAAWTRPGLSDLAPGPLSAAHVAAGVGCSSCHGGARPSSGACQGCHGGAAERSSTRTGHRAAMAQGQLLCADCHSAHGGSESVTFAGDGLFTRSGDGASRTSTLPHASPPGAVPLVPASVCVRCHSFSAATDPALRCVSDPRGDLTKQADLCMDEHLTVDSLRGARRLAVWESARAVARSTAWTEVPARGAATAWALLPLGSAALSLALVRVARKRRERAARSAAPVAPAALDKRRLPQIDPSRCLGCYACVDACPFAVLEVQRFVAVVARPADCCGVVACAEVCPNGSLSITGEPLAARQLRLGAGSLESLDAPGVFVAGDVTGVPLIRNAIEHGERVIRAIATARSASSGDALDVLIVGAGPAGLSAALSAKRAGLSFEILEQSTVASSVRSFPRSKIVLDHREGDVANSALWVGETTKELLLLEWQRALRTEGVAVREGFRVANISKKGSFFEIEVANREPPEATFLARNVVLATGRRGTPRRLGAHVADGCDNKVSYSLADARSFAGQRVLVVGLGDAAMEAALALAQQPNTVVTVCHRGDDFSRGKPRNIESMRAALAAGRILAMFSSEVVEISRRDVTLRSAGIDRTLGNDAVLVLIGGEPEGALLKLAGVRFENE